MAFSISIDLKSGVPIYRQIIDQVKSAIATGTLGPGDRLPTVRQLAVDLSVNPNTVSRAYNELELTGLVETHMGSGTFIGDKRVERDEVERRRMLDHSERSCASSPRRLRIVATVLSTYLRYSSMRSTASRWLPCQSRSSKRRRARRVMARNSVL